MRRIWHHTPSLSDTPIDITSRAVEGCWFELHRQGGCGPGELRLSDTFANRSGVDVGDWISFELDGVGRWYAGRVASREANTPAGVVCRLEGMSTQLAEVFPGGFQVAADGRAPHRYASADLFPDDPDHASESVDTVAEPADVVKLLLTQYVAPETDITYDVARVESFGTPVPVDSLKFRGEESALAIIKELAVRAGGASWGVDPSGTFFFTEPDGDLQATYQAGVDCLSLEELRDRELIYNRLLLTGGYVYADPLQSGEPDRVSYRWRGNYVETDSVAAHGERRVKLWIPWIRTHDDAMNFARGFFGIYAAPTDRYRIEVAERQTILLPWSGPVRLLDAAGGELANGLPETIRVRFDRGFRVTLELGPTPPSELWPEPPQDERWPLPSQLPGDYGGGQLPDDGSGCDLDFATISGLELHWSAGDLTLGDGDPVASWTDAHAGLTVSEATSSKQPTYLATALGSRPAVRGDGINDLLASASLPVSAQSDNYTWFVVFASNSATADQAIFRLGHDFTDQALTVDFGTVLFLSSQPGSSTPDAVSAPTSLTTGQPYLYTIRRDSTAPSLTLWENGVFVASLSASSATARYGTTPDVRFFQRDPATGDEYGACDVAEAVVYSEVLSDTDRAAVETCLMEKYGLTS